MAEWTCRQSIVSVVAGAAPVAGLSCCSTDPAIQFNNISSRCRQSIPVLLNHFMPQEKSWQQGLKVVAVHKVSTITLA
jgi:hypothetical protein